MAGTAQQPMPVVVLISGRGSNLGAILEAVQRDDLPIEIRAVISNRPQAAGITLARAAGLETVVIDHACHASRATFETALQSTIDAFHPELVILAGFMRILTAGFVEHYHGRLVNIHPSLLPEFPGLNTHQRVLDAGRTVTGATVHFVTPETDAGPVIMQAQVPVRNDDTAATLAARVLESEHRLYPAAIRLLATGRITRDAQGRVLLDGNPADHVLLPDPGPVHDP